MVDDDRATPSISPIDLSTQRPVLTSADVPTEAVQEKLERLRSIIGKLDSLVVCFSGGVDSAFLLRVAHDVLGSRCVAMTAVSPSLPAREREATQKVADEIGVRHILVESAEIKDPAYVENPERRCYFCKKATFDLSDNLLAELDFAHVGIGTNLDDLGDHRPGQTAAQERGVVEPLVEARFRKNDVRRASQLLGLSVWDKPEAACLSSRVPYGTSITVERLGRIEASEEALRELGFKVFRVRYHGEVARIEIGPSEMARAFDPEVRPSIISRFKAAGFKYVSLDLEGYRRGSMNE